MPELGGGGGEGFGRVISYWHCDSPVADDLNGAAVRAHAYVALVTRVVAHVEGVPTAVLEFRSGGVEREFASAAAKVALLRKKCVVCARRKETFVSRWRKELG